MSSRRGVATWRTNGSAVSTRLTGRRWHNIADETGAPPRPIEIPGPRSIDHKFFATLGDPAPQR
jgi:hypothetical protein